MMLLSSMQLAAWLTAVIASSLLSVPAVCGASLPDATCLTQKMLISCTAASPGVIACGGATDPPAVLATEVLLNWDHNASVGHAYSSRFMGILSLELSKPASDLSLVLLDLSGAGLCTGRSSAVPLNVSFAADPGGPRLVLRGLRLPTVDNLSLQGNIVIDNELLASFPALKYLMALRNNVSVSYEPQARYSVSGSASLTSLRITGSIHSLAYGTPLLASLASLTSARLNQNNLILLKSGAFVGLPALRYLYLSANNIRDLAPGSLAGLGSLEQLFLNTNGLGRIADYAFADLASLVKLSLANNRLNELQPNAFHGLVRLQSLDLSENLLTRLPETLFMQLHSLTALNLQQNRNLQSDHANDTFCPLESLKTLWTSMPFDCERFGAPGFDQLIIRLKGQPKKYSCDISQMEPTQRPCHNWLGRLEHRQQMHQTLRGQVDELPALGSPTHRQPSQLHVTLLIIFGVICLIHVLTTGVTIYACRRIRRARRAAGQRKSPSLSSPDEEEHRSLDASPGRVSNGKDLAASAAVPGRLHNNPAGNSGKKDRDGAANNRLNVRDKSYDFNEDENHA